MSFDSRQKKLTQHGFNKLAGANKKAIRCKRTLETGHGAIIFEADHIGTMQLLKIQERKCFYCREILEFGTIVRDHFFPRSISWRNKSIIRNSVLSCFECDQRKGAELPSMLDLKRFFMLYNCNVLVLPDYYNGAHP